MVVLLNPEDPLSYLLTLDQAAEEVDKKPATVRDWIRKGYLTPMRLPGSRKKWTTGSAIRAAEREAWLHTPRPTRRVA